MCLCRNQAACKSLSEISIADRYVPTSAISPSNCTATRTEETYRDGRGPDLPTSGKVIQGLARISSQNKYPNHSDIDIELESGQTAFHVDSGLCWISGPSGLDFKTLAVGWLCWTETSGNQPMPQNCSNKHVEPQGSSIQLTMRARNQHSRFLSNVWHTCKH